jgi:hypothetical protein
MDVIELGCDVVDLAQYTDQLCALVKTVLNLLVSYETKIFLTQKLTAVKKRAFQFQELNMTPNLCRSIVKYMVLKFISD